MSAPPPVVHAIDVAALQRGDRVRQRAALAVILFLTLVVGVMAYAQAPQPFSLAFLGLVLSCLSLIHISEPTRPY